MEWFTSMNVIEQVFFWIATIATVLLIVQIILLVVAFAGGTDIDGDGDLDINDGDMDTDGGLSLFTVKSITAFFALGGWCGFAAATFMEDNLWAPILISVLTGAVALVGVAFAMRAISKLQCSGNLVPEKLIGMAATVYVSIPASRKGRGKITLTAQGKFMEIDAVTDETEKLSTDEQVTILSYADDFAVVERTKI